MKPIDPDEYEKQTAEVTNTILNRSIQIAYPQLSGEDHNAMVISVIDRLARMRGYGIRLESIMADDGE